MKSNTYLWIGLAIVVVVVATVLLWKGTAGTAYEPTPLDGTATTTPVANDNNTPPAAGTLGKPYGVTSNSARPTATTAVVGGTVNPRNTTTTYWFEYGTTMSYGSTTSASTLQPAFANVQVVGSLVGLKPATPYYFRLASRNSYGTNYGSVFSFITPAK